MQNYTRRAMALALASVIGLAGCQMQNKDDQAPKQNFNPEKLEARVDATIGHMFQEFPGSREIAAKAEAMLVMPLITEAGVGFGGSFGRGALRQNGQTVDYYSAASGSVGLQFGAQQYAHVLFFMTEDALEAFREREGWTIGADVEYAFANTGDGARADSNVTASPIVAILFAQAGLRIGFTLEGLKYTVVHP
jgi:lipid-binding SYLF domain-containing protein